jgi:hypothetical protein
MSKNFRQSKRKIQELDTPVNLVVHTKCPSKWILIDTETGESYQGNNGGYWDKLKIYTKDSAE